MSKHDDYIEIDVRQWRKDYQECPWKGVDLDALENETLRDIEHKILLDILREIQDAQDS